jgi:hypothetical protein
MLEARAHADLSRTDLALEVLDGEAGADFDRLRTSILWNARRWREAGEAGEALLGQALGRPGAAERTRAARSYARRHRLRAGGGTDLARAAEAEIRPQGHGLARRKDLRDRREPGGAQTREFRLAAQEATKADSLRLLLGEWRAQALDAQPEAEARKPASPAPVPRADGAPRDPARG